MLGESLIHGWPSVLIGYAAVQLPMVVGLARSGGAWHRLIASPLVAAPLAALVEGAMSASTPLLSYLGSVRGVAEFALATSMSALLGYAGGRTLAADAAPGDSHRRGALVAERPSRVERQPGPSFLAITVAGRAVALEDETKHFKLIGTTGTGKSTAIREILSAALARGDRAVIADPDGGYLRRFFNADRCDTILNPFDERSVKWDLFSEIRTPYDVEQLARSLIPDHEGSDRSWRGYARTFLSAVTRRAHEAGVTDTAELYRLMMVADRTELRALVEGTPAQPFLEEHNSRMFDSIRSVTSAAIGPLEYIAQQKGTKFSIRSWVAEDRRGVLFMPYSAGQIAALRSTISAWMRLAIFEAMDPREPAAQGTARRLWFVVDELDALGQIDGLKDALARLRKFGGRCVLGFQSLAQVSSTYGPGEAHTIVENCGNTLILRCSASEGGGTARFASQLVGEREVLRTSISRSRRATEFIGTTSRSEHVSVEHALLASQIEQLPDLTGYLKYASEPTWQRVQLSAPAVWQDGRRADAARARSAAARSNEGHEYE
ncbi:MAG: type IV secretion system DNA-binding domain-containing protein [Steroidobacteraceae bacterium]